jgi:hypothetical protein
MGDKPTVRMLHQHTEIRQLHEQVVREKAERGRCAPCARCDHGVWRCTGCCGCRRWRCVDCFEQYHIEEYLNPNLL